MKNLFITGLLLVFSLSLSAQTTDKATIQKTKDEIIGTFGFYPTLFEIVPDYQVPGMWSYFIATTGPQNAIPPKYRELINLAVAAQIPCDYCIYFHTEAAQAYGATEDEVKEAVVTASSTRAWSMILQGNGVELDQFKDEFKKMMAFMAEKASKK